MSLRSRCVRWTPAHKREWKLCEIVHEIQWMLLLLAREAESSRRHSMVAIGSAARLTLSVLLAYQGFLDAKVITL